MLPAWRIHHGMSPIFVRNFSGCLRFCEQGRSRRKFNTRSGESLVPEARFLQQILVEISLIPHIGGTRKKIKPRDRLRLIYQFGQSASICCAYVLRIESPQKAAAFLECSQADDLTNGVNVLQPPRGRQHHNGGSIGTEMLEERRTIAESGLRPGLILITVVITAGHPTDETALLVKLRFLRVVDRVVPVEGNARASVECVFQPPLSDGNLSG